MAKGTASSESTDPVRASAGRQARKLERRLAAAHDLEAKRRKQVDKAHAGKAKPRVVAKRERQLEEASRRAAEVTAELATLATEAPSTVEPEVSADAPRGYCLREKITVTIVDPAPFVMHNGRSAIAGTCPGCGARIVRP